MPDEQGDSSSEESPRRSGEIPRKASQRPETRSQKNEGLDATVRRTPPSDSQQSSNTAFMVEGKDISAPHASVPSAAVRMSDTNTRLLLTKQSRTLMIPKTISSHLRSSPESSSSSTPKNDDGAGSGQKNVRGEVFVKDTCVLDYAQHSPKLLPM